MISPAMTTSFWSDFFLARSALFVCFFLPALGYCIGLSTSVRVPLQKFPFLGFISDTCLQAFTIIPPPPPQRRNLLLFCVTSCHERLWSFSRYKSWLVNAFQWPQLFLVPASLQMRPTWPFLELFAFLCLFRFCAALRAEIEHWLFWILGMVFSLGKQSVIALL